VQPRDVLLPWLCVVAETPLDVLFIKPT